MLGDESLYLPTSPVLYLDSFDVHDGPSDQINNPAADDKWIHTEANAFATSITSNLKTENEQFRVSKWPNEKAVATVDESALAPRNETRRKPYNLKMGLPTPPNEVS